jgi:pectinesterase
VLGRVAVAATLLCASTAPAQGTVPVAPSAPNAVVDARHTGAEGAVVAGMPTYRTVNAALAAAPGAAQAPWVIRVRDGRYREKVSVDKPNVWLVGDSRDGTVITWDDAAGMPARGGGTIGTRGSWTLRATVADFRAERLTIENAFDYEGNARKPAGDPTKLEGTQGVALALTDRSDRALFVDVRLLGNQDTFFANAGRAYFRRCEIVGNVDFIFGAGRVVFEDCDVVSLDRGSRTNNGIIVAPSTDVASGYGFLFLRSRLKKQRPQMAPGSVMLGRPWHPSADPRAVGSAVFVECWMDDHIAPQGWDRMSSTTEGGERIWFEPNAARFFEYRSAGPGAVASPTRRVLSDGDARSYTPALVLDGWIPFG